MKTFDDITTAELEQWLAELMHIHTRLINIHASEHREAANAIKDTIAKARIQSKAPMEVFFSVLYTGTMASLQVLINRRKNELSANVK